ncbi:MAG: hypothetical protein RML56_14995 [Burkholderiales bacterium]|nr:hypothetical protein [Burkholderiales bacterium]
MFEPDLFIVDKEPLGLRGEVRETLEMLKPRGTRLVLGLRDVMDEPRALRARVAAQERAFRAARPLRRDSGYLRSAPDSATRSRESRFRSACARRWSTTGYLRREVPTWGAPPRLPEITQRPYLLVTTGGGGDGEALVEWVLRAYEHDPLLPYPALVVLGPFCSANPSARPNSWIARRA